jgi:hypothetical protein
MYLCATTGVSDECDADPTMDIAPMSQSAGRVTLSRLGGCGERRCGRSAPGRRCGSETGRVYDPVCVTDGWPTWRLPRNRHGPLTRWREAKRPPDTNHDGRPGGRRRVFVPRRREETPVTPPWLSPGHAFDAVPRDPQLLGADRGLRPLIVDEQHGRRSGAMLGGSDAGVICTFSPTSPSSKL